MRRYRKPIFMVFGLLGVITILIGAGKNQLQQQVDALEAEVAELRSESDRQPVVIDANGVEVGTVVYFESTVVRLRFEFEGIPRFLLDLEEDGLLHETAGGNTGSVVFESTDCSGTGFLPLQQPILGLHTAFHVADGSLRTYLPPLSGAEPITYRSYLSQNGCTSGFPPFTDPSSYAPAIPVPELEAFTPPFEVVTRGDLVQ